MKSTKLVAGGLLLMSILAVPTQVGAEETGYVVNGSPIVMAGTEEETAFVPPVVEPEETPEVEVPETETPEDVPVEEPEVPEIETPETEMPEVEVPEEEVPEDIPIEVPDVVVPEEEISEVVIPEVEEPDIPVVVIIKEEVPVIEVIEPEVVMVEEVAEVVIEEATMPRTTVEAKPEIEQEATVKEASFPLWSLLLLVIAALKPYEVSIIAGDDVEKKKFWKLKNACQYILEDETQNAVYIIKNKSRSEEDELLFKADHNLTLFEDEHYTATRKEAEIIADYFNLKLCVEEYREEGLWA